MKFPWTVLALALLLAQPGLAQQGNLQKMYPEQVTCVVRNPAGFARADAEVILEIAELKARARGFNEKAFVLLANNREIASQACDVNGDGRADRIVCVLDLQPSESKTLTLRYAHTGMQARPYPQRAQAELAHKVGGKFVDRKYLGGEFQNVSFLRVPPEHTDHSFYIRYEGPGWESDRIGYRFYLDWRNAADLFGKKITDMVLQHVGLDGFESYHAMSDWGMDILKVGESLGIGTLAMWQDGRAQRVSQTDSVTCAILASGPVYAQIQTKYFGWRVGGGTYNLVSDLSICAGSRLTRHEVAISGAAPNLCTGIVKLDSTMLLASPQAGTGWKYLATYGKQSLANDSLGMAVLYRAEDVLEVTADSLSHVVVLRPAHGRLAYYFLGAWEQELHGIKSSKAFEAYLDQTVAALNAPLHAAF